MSFLKTLWNTTHNPLVLVGYCKYQLEMAFVSVLPVYHLDVIMEDEAMELEDSCPSVFITYLPPELHYHICCFLTSDDLLRLALTCKELYTLIMNDTLLWKQQYISKWISDATEKFVDTHYDKNTQWKVDDNCIPSSPYFKESLPHSSRS